MAQTVQDPDINAAHVWGCFLLFVWAIGIPFALTFILRLNVLESYFSGDIDGVFETFLFFGLQFVILVFAACIAEITGIPTVLVIVAVLALESGLLYQASTLDPQRTEKRAFAARLGLAPGDPLFQAAFAKLSKEGRAEAKSVADLKALLDRRARLKAAEREEEERKREKALFL